MLYKSFNLCYNINGDSMSKIIDLYINNKSIRYLSIFIVMDVIFGFLRSIKEHKTNSTIGIDGIIRKTGMLITIIITIALDKLTGIDLIVFIPEKIKTSIGIGKCGISLLFNSLYIIFECLSIMKNMRRCGIPLPRKLNNFLDKLLKEFTSEEKKGNEKG